MNVLQSLANGIELIFTPGNLLFILIGAAFGLVMGALPGLSTTMAVALALPLTFGMSPIPSMALLMGIFTGGVSGGLISAILINIPGTPAAVATTFDGYPMAKRGEAHRALGTAMLFKCFSQLFGIAALILIAPPLARFALKFGAYEMFALTFASLTLIVTLSDENKLKGFISGILGLLLCMVGNAPIDGLPRFTFGSTQLGAGFSILPFLIGLFGISEVLKITESSKRKKRVDISIGRMRGLGISFVEAIKQLPNALISSALGLAIGILPGIGSGTSNVLAYMVSKRRSKQSKLYGTGIVDGIVAAEAGGGGAVGGAMIPMLCLGIPGDAVTAMVLGGLMLHGLQPGPLLFVNNANVVNGIFVSMLLGALVTLGLCYLGIRIFVKILKIPEHLLYPIIFILCCLGAFGSSNRVFDIIVMLGFGLIGYIMNKFDIPTTPIILGFMIGTMFETNLRRGMMMSRGNFGAFFSSPIAAILISIAVLSLVYPIIKWGIKKAMLKNRRKP